ncbi:hypothetical protein ASD92_15665 [Massilia sp. Root1485]|nr:hypothetical protein ASD92_15665 [Massilia sp. Root1485]
MYRIKNVGGITQMFFLQRREWFLRTEFRWILLVHHQCFPCRGKLFALGGRIKNKCEALLEQRKNPPIALSVQLSPASPFGAFGVSRARSNSQQCLAGLIRVRWAVSVHFGIVWIKQFLPVSG